MSETTTVRNSQGFAMVHPAPDGSLQLTVARDGDGVGTTIIGLTRESAAIIGRALTPAPAPHLENARFEDVQAGDVVRTEWEEYGIKNSREGVAVRVPAGTDDWVTDKDGWLCIDKAVRCGGTITILDRPTPQLPTEPGTVIVAGKNTFVLEQQPVSLNLVWRSIADPTDFYSHDWPGNNDWKPTGYKVVEA